MPCLYVNDVNGWHWRYYVAVSKTRWYCTSSSPRSLRFAGIHTSCFDHWFSLCFDLGVSGVVAKIVLAIALPCLFQVSGVSTLTGNKSVFKMTHMLPNASLSLNELDFERQKQRLHNQDAHRPSHGTENESILSVLNVLNSLLAQLFA